MPGLAGHPHRAEDGKMGFFDAAYTGTPPWDIGRAQGVISHLEREARIHGRVLDAGCGTGENALMLAERGHEVVGIDLSRRAIAKARRKAEGRGLPVRFLVHDVTHLDRLHETFDTVIDSGLFHTLDDGDRARYVQGLAAMLNAGGVLHMVVFSEHEPGRTGPRRVTQKEIRSAFRDGWAVERIEAACFESNHTDPCRRAWVATLRRP